MNNLITDENGKFPFFLNDIRFLDAAYRMGFEALAKAVSFEENAILFGIEITDNGDYSYTFSKGTVVINGEILSVDGVTLNVFSGNKAIISKDESWDSEGLKLFGDGNQHNTYKIIKGVITVVPESQTGDFVDISSARRISDIQNYDGLIYKGTLTNADDLNKINKYGMYSVLGDSLPDNFPDAAVLYAGSGVSNPQISQSSKFWFRNVRLSDTGVRYQEIGYRRGLLAKRNLDSMGVGAWKSQFADVSDVLEGIRKCAVISPFTLQKHGDWQTPEFNGSWSNLGPGYGSIVDDHVRFRKLTDGRIEIAGLAQSQHITAPALMFILPEGYRPARNMMFSTFVNGDADIVFIKANGEVLTNGNEKSTVVLNIVFPTDYPST